MVIGVEFFRVKAKIETTIAPVVKKVDKSLYYINTNEIYQVSFRAKTWSLGDMTFLFSC